MLALTVLALAAVALAAAPGTPPAPAGGSEDEFKVFEADLGRAWIDVTAYPPEQQKSYALFAQKCSKCHTLARPINSSLQGGDWSAYVSRMSRKAGSGISPRDGDVILSFLLFDSAKRARAAVTVDPELLPFLGVSRELSGVPRFPASRRDIRPEEGPLRIAVEGDPRLDLSRFLAGEGQKLVKWTRREPHRGELVLTGEPAPAGKAPAPPAAPDAAVRAAAAEAVGSAADPEERIERILDWLDENVKREHRPGAGDARAVLADRRGDATEFTRLFVAMAQASGVPARTRVGLVARRSGFFFACWAEAWLDRWVPVDPYLGQLPADRAHIAVAAPGDDALAGWDARAVPGLDRLQLRVIEEPKSGTGGS
jgi:hypothetical protein